MALAHFPFYPKDWLGDRNVRSASYEAQGVYVTLLAFMWQAKDGACTLPIDNKVIAKLLGMDVRRWSRIREELWPLFTIDVAACTFTQDRLRKEWLKAHGLYVRAVTANSARLSPDFGPTSPAHRPEVSERSARNFGANVAESNETRLEQAPSNQNKNQNKNQKQQNGEGAGEPNAATASPSARVGLAPVPVESWPEGLRWVPPIVERVFDRFPETFGTRGDFLQPTKWRSLEAEVDSWGQGLNQRFADELEAVLAEFQGYWTSRKSRRRDAWRTWLNACRRWHDRQLSGALRLQALKQQKPQRRIA